MEKIIIKIDDKLLGALQELVDDFPEPIVFSDNGHIDGVSQSSILVYKHNVEQYYKNQKIIDAVIEKWIECIDNGIKRASTNTKDISDAIPIFYDDITWELINKAIGLQARYCI